MCEKDERKCGIHPKQPEKLDRVMWRDCMGENNDENLKEDLI
jgi:hypothetical protein